MLEIEKEIGFDKNRNKIYINHRIVSMSENEISGTLSVVGEGFRDNPDIDGLEYQISLAETGNECELIYIIVEKKRNGLGTLLFEELKKIAKKYDCEYIYGSVMDSRDGKSKSKTEERITFYRRLDCTININNYFYINL